MTCCGTCANTGNTVAIGVKEGKKAREHESRLNLFYHTYNILFVWLSCLVCRQLRGRWVGGLGTGR